MSIDKLFETLESLKSDQSKARADIEGKIQSALNIQFKDWKVLQDAIKALDTTSDYGSDEGGIYSWVRFETSEVPEHTRDYLDAYLSDYGIHLDYKNDSLMSFQGECITVQDDTRFDNGVYDSHQLIIDPSEYTENGDIDEDKRDYLIETYMDKTGCYPGVFHVTRNGDVYLIPTQAGFERYAEYLAIDKASRIERANDEGSGDA